MYKVLVDSCGDLSPEQRKDPRIVSIPLTLEVNGEQIIDDETFDQKSFLEKVAASPTCPKSACPSPDSYMSAMEGPEEHVYVVTLTGSLSGSYNSAVLGKELYEEEHLDEDNKKIYVFDSRSACVGETLIAMKVMELEEQGLSFEEVVEQTEKYIEGQNTYFVLDNLDSLRKNGRLTGIKAVVAARLKIKPVMKATEIGTIQQLDQALGTAKALDCMLKYMQSELKDPENKVVGITHCNCPERALLLKEKIEKIGKFKAIHIVDSAGVASLYASDGGVVVVV